MLTDGRGGLLASGSATALAESTAEDFVPFRGTLEFTPPPAGGRGKLVLVKDDPSRLGEPGDAVAIPIAFE